MSIWNEEKQEWLSELGDHVTELMVFRGVAVNGPGVNTVGWVPVEVPEDITLETVSEWICLKKHAYPDQEYLILSVTSEIRYKLKRTNPVYSAEVVKGVPG